jgi:hypothetical protein
VVPRGILGTVAIRGSQGQVGTRDTQVLLDTPVSRDHQAIPDIQDQE